MKDPQAPAGGHAPDDDTAPVAGSECEAATVSPAGTVTFLPVDGIRPDCPTCTWPNRETVDMVCQTCGFDHGGEGSVSEDHTEVHDRKGETMTLTDFLLARIAEDEADAEQSRDDDGDWFDSLHQQRWVPARVLAECEAKRRIVAAHVTQCEDDDPYAWIVGSKILLRHLAAVYADHPDYREEWRP